MPKQIVWSALSESDFAGILNYLNENWDKKVTNQFIDLTENILAQISINPRQFPVIFKKKKISPAPDNRELQDHKTSGLQDSERSEQDYFHLSHPFENQIIPVKFDTIRFRLI